MLNGLFSDPFACPQGWLKHERLCYYFSGANDKQRWLDAEQSCEDMGAELGYIADAAAESFITGILFIALTTPHLIAQ